MLYNFVYVSAFRYLDKYICRYSYLKRVSTKIFLKFDF